jgi:hypothetical protein
MVMTCEKTTFVKTVDMLKAYQQKLKQVRHLSNSNGKHTCSSGGK